MREEFRMKSSPPALHTIDLGGETVEYTLRFSRKAKRQRIKVGVSGVEIVLPVCTDAQLASTFLTQHGNWVLRHLKRIRKLQTLRGAHDCQDKPSLLLRGRDVRVRVQDHPLDRQQSGVVSEGDVITVFTPTGSRVSAQRALTSWLRRQAEQDIAICVRERAAHMQLQPNRLFIRDQRTRWGSCSSKRNLSFNWRLICAPPDVLDYVVVHELAHLGEMNHSPRFWAIVRVFCPNFERHKRWLKHNAWRLHASIAL